MRILYAAHKYDYGDPARGFSFEHANFYDALIHMGHDILYCDLGHVRDAGSRKRFNARLLDVARAENPELLFAVPFQDEFDAATIDAITQKTSTRTVAWFCDDHWRFDNYTRNWAPRFGWSVTTARSALAKYEAIGYRNVIRSQWACNPFGYRPLDGPLKYGVTFVGQPHGDRPAWIAAIRNAGIDVQVWGTGWESGRLEQRQMTEVFASSRINLNLSNASTRSQPSAQPRLRRLAGAAAGLLGSSAKQTLKRWGTGTSKPAALPPLEPGSLQLPEQIKGRNFEVPACGGFMLTGRAEDLESYYHDGHEVACFGTVGELLEKIRYYLDHEDERSAVARAGYQRTMSEHTYVHRFTDIFRRIGMQAPDAQALLAAHPVPGIARDLTVADAQSV